MKSILLRYVNLYLPWDVNISGVFHPCTLTYIVGYVVGCDDYICCIPEVVSVILKNMMRGWRHWTLKMCLWFSWYCRPLLEVLTDDTSSVNLWFRSVSEGQYCIRVDQWNAFQPVYCRSLTEGKKEARKTLNQKPLR